MLLQNRIFTPSRLFEDVLDSNLQNGVFMDLDIF